MKKAHRNIKNKRSLFGIFIQEGSREKSFEEKYSSVQRHPTKGAWLNSYCSFLLMDEPKKSRDHLNLAEDGQTKSLFASSENIKHGNCQELAVWDAIRGRSAPRGSPLRLVRW